MSTLHERLLARIDRVAALHGLNRHVLVAPLRAVVELHAPSSSFEGRIVECLGCDLGSHPEDVMTFPEEAAYWTDDADGDPVLPVREPEGTDEQLHALVLDAHAVGDVARRYARLYRADVKSVHAAVEATLHVLEQRGPVEGGTPLKSPAPERCDAKLSDPNEGDLHCKLLEGHGGWHLGGHATVWQSDSRPAPAEQPLLMLCWNCSDAIEPGAAHSIMDGCGHRLCERCQDGDHACAAPPAEEPVSVPPPVDALLTVVKDWCGEGGASWRFPEVDAIAHHVWASGVAEGRRLAAEELERAAAEQVAEAKRRRELMRFPSDRPGWLGSGQPWPCGRCGVEVDDEDPHACRTNEEAADLPADEPPAVDGG